MIIISDKYITPENRSNVSSGTKVQINKEKEIEFESRLPYINDV